MKKISLLVGLILSLNGLSFAQNSNEDTPQSPQKETPQYQDPFKMMENMMKNMQKIFGGDSLQNFGFQQFKMNPNDSADGFNFSMPFGDMKSFGFSMGPDGWKMMTPDSSTNQQFEDMRKRMQDRMPDFGNGDLGSFFKNFENLLGGQMPFGDPSVLPPTQPRKEEGNETPTNKKKYKTEKL